MKFRIIRLISAIVLAGALASCSDDAEVSSGGGVTGVGNDGGNPSAQFAGTYVGEITTTFRGDEFDDDTETDRIEIQIRNNGTALVTIEGESVEGTVDGRRVGFSIRYSRDIGLIDCDSDAILTGDIGTNRITGPVSGSGECDLLTGSSGFDISGSFTATKL